MRVIAKAPGKLLILGEHAVVYGYPAIVAAVDKYITVSIETSNKDNDEIILHGSRDDRFIKAAIDTFRIKFKKNNFLYFKTKSTFYDSVGFGSSAATVVATIKALSEFFSISITNKELFEISYDAHKKCQTSGSGVDIAASIYGGILYYDKFGKKIEKLPITSIPLIVGYSGIKAGTNIIIHFVAKIHENNNEKTEEIFQLITEYVKRGKQYLMSKDFNNFGLIMNKNQILLHQLGVSTDKLDIMIKSAIEVGAWGAKLSGAGGGDCMIALAATENKQSVSQAIKQSGGKIIDVSISPRGVQII